MWAPVDKDRFGDTHEMAVECLVFNPNLSKKDNASK